MDRGTLEQMSVEELRKEARKCRLPSVSDRAELIDALMTHYERRRPARGGRGQEPDVETGAPDQGGPNTDDEAEPVTTSRLRKALSAVTADMTKHQLEWQEQQLQLMQNQQMQFMQQQQQQFERLAQLLTAGQRGEPMPENLAPLREGDGTERSRRGSTPRESMPSPGTSNGFPHGNTIKWLSSQIPEFGGTEDENVHAWTARVDRVALIHGATDAAVLLAASSRLVKNAKKWYEIQQGEVLASWGALRGQLQKIFERNVPLYKAIIKVEARKWNRSKESFDEYAIDKMRLTHQLDLPVKSTISLLIGGLPENLQTTALSLETTTIEQFLDKMRNIVGGLSDMQKKPTPFVRKDQRPRDSCRNCGKSGHTHKECRAEPSCFYCKKPGHRQFDCPLTKKKISSQPERKPQQSTVAAAMEAEEESPETVAAVLNESRKLELQQPWVTIVRVAGVDCKCTAMIDTGSPVSLIKNSTWQRLNIPSNVELKSVQRRFCNLSSENLKVVGMVSVKIALTRFKEQDFIANLYILEDNACDIDVVLGREFLSNNNLTLVYGPSDNSNAEKACLFANLPLFVEDDRSTGSLQETIENIRTDFEETDEDRLKTIIRNVNSETVIPVEDEYEVHVRLKDPSVFAFAPRKFAFAQRLQIREVVDDLLRRGVIQPSVSPYCSRIVPIRKKNGQIRLCIDLRPLNSRVEKQKYPFPLIEECLSRLANSAVFTLLDLRDSFHQIKVHKDSTKYFAFATPDGQYEYKRLPFGFSESPAEFQKRIIQILNPLIRRDEILVYIDDILIPSDSVDSNLLIIEEVMRMLKRYGFELNLEKCKFLRKKVEYLGYLISADGITLSDRHTEAIDKFKVPRTVKDVQRFLGLANYFRRFVKDFAKGKTVAGPAEKERGIYFRN